MERVVILGRSTFGGFVHALAFVAIVVQGKARGGDIGELERIAATYRIEIVAVASSISVATTHGKIEGKSAPRKVLEQYAGLFAGEFGLYPPDLVKRAQLERVVLCEKLAFEGQRRNAIPDYDHDTLYLDVSRGSYSKPYLRAVIHHEFFHIVDYRDNGSVYQDEQWEALNPTAFRYGRGGRTVQDSSTESDLTDKHPGFLNHYSTTGVEEDKAEVFANFIVHADYVEQRAKQDGVLEAKVNRMKKLLFDFCPDVNEDFWEKVRNGKRSDD